MTGEADARSGDSQARPRTLPITQAARLLNLAERLAQDPPLERAVRKLIGGLDEMLPGFETGVVNGPLPAAVERLLEAPEVRDGPVRVLLEGDLATGDCACTEALRCFYCAAATLLESGATTVYLAPIAAAIGVKPVAILSPKGERRELNSADIQVLCFVLHQFAAYWERKNLRQMVDHAIAGSGKVGGEFFFRQEAFDEYREERPGRVLRLGGRKSRYTARLLVVLATLVVPWVLTHKVTEYASGPLVPASSDGEAEIRQTGDTAVMTALFPVECGKLLEPATALELVFHQRPGIVFDATVSSVQEVPNESRLLVEAKLGVPLESAAADWLRGQTAGGMHGVARLALGRSHLWQALLPRIGESGCQALTGSAGGF